VDPVLEPHAVGRRAIPLKVYPVGLDGFLDELVLELPAVGLGEHHVEE